MNQAPFSRLFLFINRHLMALTITVGCLQLVVLAIDAVVFADRGKSPIVPLLEAVSPWLLLPLLRWVFRSQTVKNALNSPYLALIGGYVVVLSGVTIGFILAFQVLNWIYHGQMHGGIFYYASLVMTFIWAARPVRLKSP